MITDDQLHEVGLDPQSVVDQIRKGKNLDDSIEACLVQGPRGYSAKYARSKLVPEYRSDVARMLKECVQKAVVMSRLEGLLRKAGLNPNWMIATVCLAAQDASVKRTAELLGIPLVYEVQGKTRFRNAQQLMGEIEKSAKREGKGIEAIALGVARQWNMRFRNGVIHDGRQVSEKESQRILEATDDLLDELSAVIS